MRVGARILLLGARSCGIHATQLQLSQVRTKLHRTHGRASNKCAQFITARHSRPVEPSLARLTSKIPPAAGGAMSDRPSVRARDPVPPGDAVAADDDVPALLPRTRARTHGASSDSGQSALGGRPHGHTAEAPPSAMRRAGRAGGGRGTQPSARTNRGAISVPARVPFDLVGRPAPGVAQGHGASHTAAPRRREQVATPFTEEDLERGACVRAARLAPHLPPRLLPSRPRARCPALCSTGAAGVPRALRTCRCLGRAVSRAARRAARVRSITCRLLPAPRLARNAVREATQHLLASVTSPARECHQPASRCANAGLESIAEVPGDDRNGHDPGPAMMPPAAPARAKPWPWDHPCAYACAPADEPRGACTS